jgi:small-conductance mechanosensitive channel
MMEIPLPLESLKDDLFCTTNSLVMPGRGREYRNYFRDLYAYWREEIIRIIGFTFFVLAFAIPYLVWNWIPEALKSLFLIIFVPSFVTLALMTWSFMKTTAWGNPYVGSVEGPHEPTQWVDFRLIFEKYRKYLVIGGVANVVFFICLAGYFLMAGQRMNQELSSYITGAFIFFFWLILNGLIVAASCLSLYFRELNQE